MFMDRGSGTQSWFPGMPWDFYETPLTFLISREPICLQGHGRLKPMVFPASNPIVPIRFRPKIRKGSFRSNSI